VSGQWLKEWVTNPRSAEGPRFAGWGTAMGGTSTHPPAHRGVDQECHRLRPQEGRRKPACIGSTLLAINDNYLNVQQNIVETLLDRGQLRRLAQPTITAAGKRIPSLKLDNPRQLAFMRALVRFSHIAAGNNFTTAELHLRVVDALRSNADSCTRASLRYDLSNFAPSASSKSCRTRAAAAPSQRLLDLPRLPEALRTRLRPLIAGLLSPIKATPVSAANIRPSSTASTSASSTKSTNSSKPSASKPYDPAQTRTKFSLRAQ